MLYEYTPAYPTPQHALAAERITGFFAQRPGVETVLLIGSCARGKAVRDSCIDVFILTEPELPRSRRDDLEQAWQAFYASDPAFPALRQMGKYAHVDLDFTDGRFDPAHHYHGWTSGADEFELTVGNLLAYSAPLWERADYYRQLKAQWLPYYDETLRQERLAMARHFCLNNLHHIPPIVPRGLYFQAFRRLYNALGEFLQALFIARSVYPIAYDKWIKEQMVDILGLPELYPQLVSLLEVRHLESDELIEKGRTLETLLEHYTAD